MISGTSGISAEIFREHPNERDESLTQRSINHLSANVTSHS